MAKRRGSALSKSATIMAALMVISVLLQPHYVQAATYVVGGDLAGWGYNVIDWTAGRTYKGGDILVFKYDYLYHNVVEVDNEGYTNCKTPPGSKIYKSGNDQITLSKGQSFFICNITGHCDVGRMKIAVTAI